MGQSRPIICNECGNHWNHMDGKGVRSAIYFCDLCDNRKNLFQDKANKQDSSNLATIKQCKCGDTFMLDTKILCPQCHSTDLEVVYQEVALN